MRLTQQTVDGLRFEGPRPRAPQYVWDESLPCFGVRVYPSGERSYVVSYRHAGRFRIMVLGSTRVMPLAAARDMARVKRVDVIHGKDPAEERRAARRGETMTDLCDAYIERHAGKKKTGSEDLRRIELHVKKRWGTTQVKRMTREEIGLYHDKLGRRSPYEANRLLALLSKMFELARLWGYLPELSPNPAKRLDRFPEVKRRRWVRHDEMPDFVTAIEGEPNVWIRAAIWLYILTGSRKKELLSIRWDQVHLKRGAIALKDTKNGEDFEVILSPPAIELLARLPRLASNVHVFPGHVHGEPLKNIYHAWYRIRRAAKIPDVRLHDLRRTVGSWLACRRIPGDMIGRVLNHKDLKMTLSTYAFVDQEPMRVLLTEHAEELQTVTGRTPSDVLPAGLSGAVLETAFVPAPRDARGRIVKRLLAAPPHSGLGERPNTAEARSSGT